MRTEEGEALVAGGRHNNRELLSLGRQRYLVSSIEERHAVLQDGKEHGWRVCKGIGEGHQKLVYGASLLDDCTLVTCSSDRTAKVADI